MTVIKALICNHRLSRGTRAAMRMCGLAVELLRELASRPAGQFGAAKSVGTHVALATNHKLLQELQKILDLRRPAHKQGSRA